MVARTARWLAGAEDQRRPKAVPPLESARDQSWWIADSPTEVVVVVVAAAAAAEIAHSENKPVVTVPVRRSAASAVAPAGERYSIQEPVVQRTKGFGIAELVVE